MELNDNIFRANDIRGIAFEDLTEEVVFALGKALGTESINRKQNDFIIGRDGRVSSPQLFEWLSRGVLSAGCNVIDIGIVPSPVFYHSTFNLNSSSGVVITGSHNPADYNGFKILFNNNSTSSEEIQSIKKRIKEKDFLSGTGNIQSFDVVESYVEEVTNNIKLKRPLNISIDCGNGAASVVAERIYKGLGCEVEGLFCDLDGEFPNHHPDPSRPENVEDLIKSVAKNSSDIGLAFDGDADRLGVISPSGEMIFPDMQMILFSEHILKKNPNSKIVFDVKCSKLLEEAILKFKGIPVMSKTGHTFIKSMIRENGAILGGEMSGHIFFNDRWPGFDDGVYAGARMLEILSESEGEDIFSALPKLISTPEINLKTTDEEKFIIIDEFKKISNFDKGKIIEIDGIRVEFDDGWGLLRASNTSPVLVLRFEADSSKALNHIKDRFKDTLYKIEPSLTNF
jgi:phosphomannomutase/phosphoglucomutase